MPAPQGNQFWKLSSSYGRSPIFSNKDDLWAAACEYFQWVEDNPLLEEKLFHAQGVITKDVIAHPRPMTVAGLCLFLDITEQTLWNYGSKAGYEEFFDVVAKIKRAMYQQKFSGATAGMMNANIIARDLGLTDKQDVTQDVTARHSVAAEVKQITTEMPADEATRIYQDMINGDS